MYLLYLYSRIVNILLLIIAERHQKSLIALALCLLSCQFLCHGLYRITGFFRFTLCFIELGALTCKRFTVLHNLLVSLLIDSLTY